MKRSIFYPGLLLLLFFCSVLPAGAFAKSGPGKLSIFVSVLPQSYFLEKIGGDRVSVEVLVMPGKSPATYSPSPVQIAKLTKSKLFFRVGVPFEERLLPRIKSISKKLKIVDTRNGIKLRKMESHHHGDSDHHKHKDHGHGLNNDESNQTGSDPHIWLSPVLVKKQARTIYEALAKEDPAGTEYYESRLSLFMRELDIADNKIRKKLLPHKGKPIFVFHPSYGYFTDEYHLIQKAVEVEGKSPSGKELLKFIERAKHENIKTVFIQPQFDKRAALKIAKAIEGRTVPLNPLAKDYFNNIYDIADKINRALTVY